MAEPFYITTNPGEAAPTRFPFPSADARNQSGILVVDGLHVPVIGVHVGEGAKPRIVARWKIGTDGWDVLRARFAMYDGPGLCCELGHIRRWTEQGAGFTRARETALLETLPAYIRHRLVLPFWVVGKRTHGRYLMTDESLLRAAASVVALSDGRKLATWLKQARETQAFVRAVVGG